MVLPLGAGLRSTKFRTVYGASVYGNKSLWHITLSRLSLHSRLGWFFAFSYSFLMTPNVQSL